MVLEAGVCYMYARRFLLKRRFLLGDEGELRAGCGAVAERDGMGRELRRC